jgi:hypothetical protein
MLSKEQKLKIEAKLQMMEEARGNSFKVTFPVPVCSLCGTDVEKFEKIVEGDTIRLVAYCHGKAEERVLDREELGGYQYKVAFNDPALRLYRGRESRGVKVEI